MRPDRGALVILLLLITIAGSVWAAATNHAVPQAWRLSSLEARIETQPALTGVIEDRNGQLLAEPVFLNNRWVVNRPEGKALAVVGLGRTLVQSHGVQGNLAGVMRTGAITARPYFGAEGTTGWLLGDPVLTAPSIPTIRLTIDAALSHEIYDLLAADRRKASVVVMNAKTGVLLAVVDYPGPDVYSDVEPDSGTSLDALYGVNLLASTMKVVSAGYVLERRPLDANKSHVCTGDRCWTAHGVVRNLEDAVVRSCNTWFRFESARWDRADWLRFISESGLQPGDTIGLPTSAIAIVGHKPNRMHWPHVVGQQIFVSAVGLVNAFASLTSAEGRQVRPKILVGDQEPGPGIRVVAPRVSARLREILWATATVGTARGVNRAYSAGNAGAKTGTGERDGRTSDAVFVAVAPWDEPEWAIVVISKGGGSGASAAGAVGRILNLVSMR